MNTAPEYNLKLKQPIPSVQKPLIHRNTPLPLPGLYIPGLPLSSEAQTMVCIISFVLKTCVKTSGLQIILLEVFSPLGEYVDSIAHVLATVV